MIGESFSKTVSKIGSDLLKRVTASMDYFMEVAKDPKATQADIDRAFQNFVSACEDTMDKSSNGAQDEIKAHVTKCLHDLGNMSQEQIDKLFEDKCLEVKGLADKMLNAMPTAKKTGHLIWLKMVAAVTVTVAVVGGAVALYTGANDDKPSPLADHMRDQHMRERQMQILTQLGQSLSVEQEEFDRMVNVLNTAPPNVQPDPVQLPAPVASVAVTPVVVTIQTADNTRTINTNIGQVYRAVPQARSAIEESADHSLNLHGSFSVSSFSGSANFSWGR
jgi:hypothetical protein